MKISKKVSALMIFLIAVFMVFISFYQYIQQKEYKLYLKSEYSRDQSIINQALEFHVKNFLQPTVDNAVWDEMVEYTVSKDQNWVHENIGPSRERFDMTYLQVYDQDGALLYSSIKPGSPPLGLNNEIVKALFATEKTVHLFSFESGHLVEIFGSAIVPSSDIQYLTIEKGYLLTAKLWDSGYISEIERATGFKVHILEDDSLDSPKLDENDTLSISVPIKTIDREGTIKLKFSKNQQLLAELESLKISIVALFGILILFITVFVYFLNHWLKKPLEDITASLEKNDPGIIVDLLKQPNEFGKIANLIVQFEDQRNELINEIKVRTLATEAAEENNRLKTAFLTNMSHEIRTPMNAIMGFSNLMAEVDCEQKDQFAEIVQKSCRQLLLLIDDVILMSRLQSEKMCLHYSEINVPDLIHEFYQSCCHSDSKQDIECAVSIPSKYHNLHIRSDLGKIRHILRNLISNALAYTNKGRIVLGFDCFDSTVEFFVSDTGIGISGEEIEKLFQVFFRGEQVTAAAIGGTGLGLNIAKEFVTLLHGEIKVSSKLDEGSRFSFTIPLEIVENKQTDPIFKQKVRKNLKDCVLLIAEDENANYTFLEYLLLSKTKGIDRAINGRLAIEMCSKVAYDLVLMDLKMPVVSGVEATKTLKQLYPEIPVIVQTAYSRPEERDAALAAGCNGYIVKPIKKVDLMYVIGKLFTID
jgi:signal transduction histidine kinase/CheY-like chemotaxis protein